MCFEEGIQGNLLCVAFRDLLCCFSFAKSLRRILPTKRTHLIVSQTPLVLQFGVWRNSESLNWTWVRILFLWVQSVNILQTFACLVLLYFCYTQVINKNRTYVPALLAEMSFTFNIFILVSTFLLIKHFCSPTSHRRKSVRFVQLLCGHMGRVSCLSLLSICFRQSNIFRRTCCFLFRRLKNHEITQMPHFVTWPTDHVSTKQEIVLPIQAQIDATVRWYVRRSPTSNLNTPFDNTKVVFYDKPS